MTPATRKLQTSRRRGRAADAVPSPTTPPTTAPTQSPTPTPSPLHRHQQHQQLRGKAQTQTPARSKRREARDDHISNYSPSRRPCLHAGRPCAPARCSRSPWAWSRTSRIPVEVRPHGSVMPFTDRTVTEIFEFRYSSELSRTRVPFYVVGLVACLTASC